MILIVYSRKRFRGFNTIIIKKYKAVILNQGFNNAVKEDKKH